jgi:hypothetical protein
MFSGDIRLIMRRVPVDEVKQAISASPLLSCSMAD